MEFTPYAQRLLKERYFVEGEETWEQLIDRVARHAAPDDEEKRQWYYDFIVDGRFIPSRMPYMGTENPFCASCFVLGPIEDSRKSIFSVLTMMAEVESWGGGVGYNFGRLRPEGDIISTTRGKASGPCSFMLLYNEVTRCITRNGNKGGAQMAVLPVSHPDIYKFLRMKDSEQDMVNFNISVSISDDFMQAVKQNAEWDLVFNGRVYETVVARDLYEEIAQRSWKNGEPGVLFMDTINHLNPFDRPIEACNACSEAAMPNGLACLLGSVNVSKFYDKDAQEFDWSSFREAVHVGIYFLNDSLDHSWNPVPELLENSLHYRNLGLGVMGFADLLIDMGIPYDSPEAIRFTDELGHAFMLYSWQGAELYANRHGTTLNTTVNSIAPTGSIATLAGCSFSIEPIFGLTFMRNTTLGQTTVVDQRFERIARERGFYSEELMAEVARSGSVQHIDEIPEDVRLLFRTANEISWQRHVEMQATWQKHIDQSIAKTINLPASATIEDVEDAFMLAYDLGCKSTTVYRDQSRQVQAVTVGTEKKVKALSEIGLKMNLPEAADDPEFCVDCSL